jgi:hypothetical protein
MLMRTEKKIKIIKHAERNDSQAAGSDKRPTSAGNHPEDTKRDAVTIVTEWVSELRRKKALEAAHGFQSVFGKAG